MAPHTEKGRGIHQLEAQFKQMRLRIENDGAEISDEEMELQRQIIDLNARRKRKAV